MNADQIPTEDATAPKAVWNAPSVEELDFASTEASFGGRGMDMGMYAS